MKIQPQCQRSSERRSVALSSRITWKDHRGIARFATVITRNVADFGVYVECHSPVAIPLYRLVHFQLEHDARRADAIPGWLRAGRVLSAVYRISPASQSKPQGLALRLMIDPHRIMAGDQVRATA